MNSWNHTLEVLLKLQRAFQIEFDQETYPEWLRPGSKCRKKPGYFDTLLAAKITIHPPAPIPKLLASKAELKQVQPRLKEAPKPKLTSNEIKEARTAKGWTQAQLAGWLGVSQPLCIHVGTWGANPCTRNGIPNLASVKHFTLTYLGLTHSLNIRCESRGNPPVVAPICSRVREATL
ncbi:helix-turn-helix domain-containing protein [Microcoleus sp. herbarium12]|uniref:helix-turn-helix domain-containing protein n=1 Tax=Microcoleus sp. herbarium12 TaxID=3055437 RepID=UPI002FD14125